MRVALIGIAILCFSSACSQQPSQPDAKPKSRFTQSGFDAISLSCGLPGGTVLVDGASTIRFGTAVTSEYKNLNCIQTKIRETYYSGAKNVFVGNEMHNPEGDNAQTH